LFTSPYIAGEWASGDGEPFDVLDPATGEVLASVAGAGTRDLQSALAAASDALPSWSQTAPRVRGEVLRRAFELMHERADELARLMTLEMGKTLADACAEVAYAAEFFRWFAEEAPRIGGELRTAPSGANRILTLRKPVGVCLLVTPWNFPAAMATRKIGPALAAGCTVVLKPAEDTPLTALYLAGLLAEAGAPAGVVNVLPTAKPGPLVAAALADERVRKLSFTGSTAVGRLLLTQAAPRVLRCSMELGGNAPFIVLEDADVDAAVDGAMIAKMRNGGQACTAANRFLVRAEVAEEFTAKLADRMAALRLGPGIEESTSLGPMVNRRAVERITALVDDAVAGGAKVRLGGSPTDGPGFFYPATVLTDADPASTLAAEEVFGPVATIYPAGSDEEILAQANATEYGLTGYLYTGDLARGLRIGEQLEVGMIGLNRGLVSDPAAPFGGVRQSGLGREGGFEGIEEYLETSYIATNW
jgi:succinate-semialdehyde dehydrogenase/glutarate-semialdehyde dehydrogenase